MTHLWLRSEARRSERRTPLTPRDAAELVRQGWRITVEDSPTRVFSTQAYATGGCDVVPAGSWVDAPASAYVLGIKELPEEPAELRHTHIFFGHAYKGQDGAADLLARFTRGGGGLLDLEYLTVDDVRVVAFGHWAGYVGAALAVLHARAMLDSPLQPMERADLDARLRSGTPVRALVIGARGRSGRGACEALEIAGCQVTRWDRKETVDLDKSVLLDHDLLVNCVVSTSRQEPFVVSADLTANRELRVVADVTCDVTSDKNLLPVNDAITTWEEPVRRLDAGAVGRPPLDVIAIDNLPSLLPREASASFSADLVRLLPALPDETGPWAAAREMFDQAVGSGGD